MSEVAPLRRYKCDVCGKVESWGPSWCWKLKLHKREMWDETITLCSDKCRLKYENKGKRKSTQ